jgi:Kef-type K+ transport system membrane component KefB
MTFALPLLQLALILAVTAACGWLLARLGQPRVVGQIAGGLLLGPLAFGYFFPTLANTLFAPSRLHTLEIVSNIGLVLFLFVIGADLNLAEINKNRGATFAITLGSIAAPFALGLAIAPLLFTRFATPGASHTGFYLFAGIAMSITALPVLASILKDREQAGRPVDTATAAHALLSAAANDLVAWCALAITLTLLHHDAGMRPALLRLLTLAAFVGLMLYAVRPIAARLAPARLALKTPRWLFLLCITALAFLSAHITDTLGIHAFFGAFLAGLCVPRTSLADETLPHTLNRTLQPLIRITLPVFFALTGLRMQRSMFSRDGLAWLAVILAVAVAGKIGGAALAARASGMAWPTASRIGILLNTRGLVELIVLNIGYREGILSPTLFTLFVLMAILTTAMTVPLLNLAESATKAD